MLGGSRKAVGRPHEGPSFVDHCGHSDHLVRLGAKVPGLERDCLYQQRLITETTIATPAATKANPQIRPVSPRERPHPPV